MLVHIEQQDQQIRAAILAVGMDSKEAVLLFQQMQQVDSVNQLYVRQLLNTSGWPVLPYQGVLGNSFVGTEPTVSCHFGHRQFCLLTPR